jgi:hypothetical protein
MEAGIERISLVTRRQGEERSGVDSCHPSDHVSFLAVGLEPWHDTTIMSEVRAPNTGF